MEHVNSRKVLYASTVELTTVQFVLDQANFLQKIGWEVHVVHAPSEKPHPNFAGIDVHEIHMSREISPLKDIIGFTAMLRTVAKVRPDVIWAGTLKASLLTLTAGKILGVRHRIYLVRGVRYEGTKGIERWLLQTAERICGWAASSVIAVSPSVAELLDRDGVLKHRPIVLGRGASNGVDTDIFRPDGPDYRENLVTLGIDSTSTILGFVGRLAPNKGLEDLFNSFRLARETVPNLHMLLIGETETANYLKQEVLDFAKQCPEIHFLGKMDKEEIPKILRSVDFIVLPSLYREGLPNVLIEAGATAIPAITTNATGCRDAVIDGVTGLVVDVGDQIALSDAIVRLSLNKNLRYQLGLSARESVVNNYSQQEVWGHISRFLDALT